MKFCSLLVLIVLLISCSDLKKGKQLEQVASLQQQLDSIKIQWQKEQIDSIKRLQIEGKLIIDSISKHYEGQTIELNLAAQLDHYKQANIGVSELIKIHSFYPVVLAEKQKALETLKADISKGSGRREKYDDYIRFELKEIQTIKAQFNNYQATKKRSLDYFNESKEIVDSFLITIN